MCVVHTHLCSHRHRHVTYTIIKYSVKTKLWSLLYNSSVLHSNLKEKNNCFKEKKKMLIPSHLRNYGSRTLTPTALNDTSHYGKGELL